MQNNHIYFLYNYMPELNMQFVIFPYIVHALSHSILGSMLVYGMEHYTGTVCTAQYAVSKTLVLHSITVQSY